MSDDNSLHSAATEGDDAPLVATDDAKLAKVVRTLSLHCWSSEHMDRDLRNSLDACLEVLDAVAVIVHFAAENVTLVHSRKRARKDEATLTSQAREVFKLTPRDLIVERVDDLYMVGRTIRENCRALRNAGWAGDRSMGYSALCFKTLPQHKTRRERFVNFHTTTSVGVLFQVLKHRTHMFLPFAPKLSERYWIDSGRDEVRDKLTPPWQADGGQLRTVTLGFDLRKSTFCMENADNPIAFARWLDQLVQILMSIAHLYNGVFDKFTGDGVLIHFLDGACHLLDGRTAVNAAVLCAIAMQHAVKLHIKRLRRILRLNSYIIGGAIGIDVAAAYWSLDHRQNPITVGRGVVNACRLMDKTVAGRVRLTNIAYQELPDRQLRQLFTEVPFTSKEFGKEMQITAWELRDTNFPSPEAAAIEAICGTAWGQTPKWPDVSSAIAP